MASGNVGRSRRSDGEGALEAATDAELITRAAGRDHAAFAVLYRRHASAVFRLALRRLRDRGRAEDVTQEVFASVWRAAAGFRPDRGAGAPWLYAIARNAIVDRARARTDAPAEPPELPDLAPGPVEHAEDASISRLVHRAVERLPANERALIELAYWSGLSQSEIATRLTLPLGTVKTRMRRALARLADELEHEQLP